MEIVYFFQEKFRPSIGKISDFSQIASKGGGLWREWIHPDRERGFRIGSGPLVQSEGLNPADIAGFAPIFLQLDQ